MNFWSKLTALFRKEKLDAEMSEELCAHLELQARENLARGMAPDEARHAARREFGGVEQIKERCRDERARGILWLEHVAQDLRYAVRQVRRNPGFAATAIAILALGIGATTAIFSVVNAVVLKPLHYEQPGQLVQIFEEPTPGERNSVSSGVFGDWREQNMLFEGIGGYGQISLNFTGPGEPERINGLRVTANVLHLLRARPVVGRIFAPDEDQPGKEKVVVLTHALWQRHFGGDRGVVGRTMLLNDESYVIVGVLPPGFLPFQHQEFVIPLRFEADWRNKRGSHWLRAIGRLKPGVTLEQAHAELDAICARNKPLYPAWKHDWSAMLLPLQEQLVREIKPALFVLLGAVGLVLLIACTNVANLLLAKASARQKEIAVRVALGASRGRIVRQLLTESVLLSVVGGGLGLVLASWSVDGLRHVVGAMEVARTHEIAVDRNVLGLALLVAIATGILFGLVPALQSSRPDPDAALKDAARTSASGGTRLRGVLIVGEVALALVLLVGAGLLLHSFFRLVNVPPGFTPEHAFTLQITLSEQKYPDRPQRAAFYNRVAERVTALPGVEAAGLSRALPLRIGPSDRFFRVAGRANHPEPGYDIDYDMCTADYFRAMGIPLLRGRFFTPQEVATDARVAIINATMAHKIFPGEDPIGRHVGHDDQFWEIVGIIGDVRMRNLTREIEPMIYRPQSGDTWNSAILVVRTRGSPAALVASVRDAIRDLDPTLPVAQVRTLEDIVAGSVAQRRLTLVLLAAFAATALLLAATGLYGVIAYTVAQRTRELGIRVALGASGRDVFRLVVGQGMKLATSGLGIGLIGAFCFTHLLANLLFEIRPTDPLTFATVSLVLLSVAWFASWLPARRAAKVDPMVALRTE